MITRRTLFQAAAVTAAAVSPGVSAAKATHPDDALLAYGRELDGCIRDHKATCAKYRPLWDKLSARLQDETRGQDESPVAWHHRIYAEVGLEALDQQGEHPDDIIGRSDAPSRAIMAIPATTLAGLAVKARLAKFGASHIWKESYDDADWDHLVLRSLIDAVLDLAAAQKVGGGA